MMNLERDRLWSAYLDGELSARDAADLHQGLTPEQQLRLEHERGFEQSLAERLSSDSECPEDLWKRLERQSRPLRGRKTYRLRPWLWCVGAIAAAAASVMLIVSIAGLGRTPMAAGMVALPQDVQALAAESQTPGDRQAVQQFLAQEGVGLTLAPTPLPQEVRGHELKLLGAKATVVGQAKVVEILYSCCGTPAKLVLAPRHSDAAQQLQEAKAGARAWVTREVGRFVVAAVGTHDKKILLDLLG